MVLPRQTAQAAKLEFSNKDRSKNREAGHGPIATEPWTTEHIELAPSEHTVIIEDLLYMAQIRRRADTAFLTSVSEVAIDHDPWFVYQGYEFGPDGETRRMDAQTEDARYKGADFIASNLTIRTKGAFLWPATRPGAYATDLHRLVRNSCKPTTSASPQVSTNSPTPPRAFPT